MTAGLDQPRRGCSMSANTGPASPNTASVAPSQSSWRPLAPIGPATIAARMSRSVRITRGRLRTNTHRHEATVTR